MYFCGKTDIGKRRESNQDNFVTMRICDNVVLFVLCDGMGGTFGGNIASSIACNTFSEYIETKLSPRIDDDNICNTHGINFEKLVKTATEKANEDVYVRSRESSELSNMGTTLVGAVIADQKMYVANVGDSRLYEFYEKRIKQITHDHSYVQMLVDMGQMTAEEAANNPRKNILTKAIGTEPVIEVDTYKKELRKNTYYLLCSDGLYNFLSEEAVNEILFTKYDGPEDDYDYELDTKLQEMIKAANDNGGGDNITIILIKNFE